MVRVCATDVGTPVALCCAFDTTYPSVVLETVKVTNTHDVFRFIWVVGEPTRGTIDDVSTLDL